MIHTITLNPSVDYIVRLPTLQPGHIHRLQAEAIRFGGKGINVSLVLAELGLPSMAHGYVAGFTGAAIEQGLQKAGVHTDFIHLDEGFSRINIKIGAEEETELNGQGPAIPPHMLDELFRRLETVADGDIVVLSGSIPPSLPADIYERLLAKLHTPSAHRRVRTVVDTTGDALLRTLAYHPFLIKPNHHELGELFGVTLRTAAEVEPYARRLRAMGARNVLVSMAGEGALLMDEHNHLHRQPAHRGTVVSTVGAGDATVAGFLAGCAGAPTTASPATIDYAYALKLGMACGGATAFSTGIATRAEIEALLARCEPGPDKEAESPPEIC